MNVNTISKKVFIPQSAFELFGKLTAGGTQAHTALLETADEGITNEISKSGSTKNNRAKSILMLSAAAKISARDGSIKIVAYNPNGELLIKSLQAIDEIKKICSIKLNNEELLLTINENQYRNDESERLKQSSSLSVLKELVAHLNTGVELEDQTSMLIGAISFDAVDEFETYPKVNKQVDDYSFYIADQLITQDRETNAAEVIIKSFAQGAESKVLMGLKLDKILRLIDSPSPEKNKNVVKQKSRFTTQISDEHFQSHVNQIKEHIHNGDVFQLVLSRVFKTPCTNSFVSYGVLRKKNPSPYMYYLNLGEQVLFGASPESCLKVDKAREVSLYPIAGTRPRGKVAPNSDEKNYELDSKIEYQLICDDKENAEHMMLLDLARNDIARIIKSGSRRISKLKQVVKYSQVMHMVSEVKGILKNDYDALDAYKACANMGTLSGAPKIEAVKLIRKFENSARGLYGGAVAVYNANQEFDSAIIIRSAVVENGIASIGAGAGIVYDSEPAMEAQETLNKAQALLDACSYQVQPASEEVITE